MELALRCTGEDLYGEPVEEISIKNPSGVAIKVISFGATLSSVVAPDRKGVRDEITLGFDELARYLGKHPYFGATVGRFANRIAHGKFHLDGKEYDLCCNRAGHHLHGGSRGFDHVTWKASPWQRGGSAGVDFSYSSPDGEEGYPGNLSVKASYALNEQDELEISYEATTDAATLVNLTNHTYWNLRGAGSGDIKDHFIALYADHYLPVDADLTPTGEIAPVGGTAFDLRTEQRIGDAFDSVKEYDHCFVIRRTSDGITGASGQQRAARAFEATSGRGMEIFTTQPGIQFYTSNMLPNVIGRGGKLYSKHSALCLETEGFPDAPNHPAFPNQVLRPGERYKHSTRIRFFC